MKWYKLKHFVIIKSVHIWLSYHSDRLRKGHLILLVYVLYLFHCHVGHSALPHSWRWLWPEDLFLACCSGILLHNAPLVYDEDRLRRGAWFPINYTSHLVSEHKLLILPRKLNLNRNLFILKRINYTCSMYWKHFSNNPQAFHCTRKLVCKMWISLNFCYSFLVIFANKFLILKKSLDSWRYTKM